MVGIINTIACSDMFLPFLLLYDDPKAWKYIPYYTLVACTKYFPMLTIALGIKNPQEADLI
jgi:hypothetical protein